MDDNKKSTTIWLRPSVISRMDGWLEADNCQSRSEFVDKALRFYMGYLGTEDNTTYISRAILIAIQGTLTEAVSGVLQTVLESYSDQITDALQTQISAALESSIQSAMGPLMQSFQQNLQTMLEKNLAQLGSQMENAIKIDTKTFQSAIQLNMSTDDLTELMKSTLRSSKSSFIRRNMQLNRRKLSGQRLKPGKFCLRFWHRTLESGQYGFIFPVQGNDSAIQNSSCNSRKNVQEISDFPQSGASKPAHRHWADKNFPPALQGENSYSAEARMSRVYGTN